MSQSITEVAIAGADLSAKQYYPVYVDAGAGNEQVKLATSNTAITTFGFLENAPASGAIARITTSGYGIGVAGGVIKPYDDVMLDGSTGKLIIATGTGKVVVGQYRPGLVGTTATGRDSVSGQEIRIYIYENKKFALA